MSEETVSKWLIAPELAFECSAEVAAQNEVLGSEGFLKAKSEFETAFVTAFQDAESILEKYMPMLTDPALTKEGLKGRLPAEAVGYGRLHGRKGFMASRRDRAKRKASIKAAYDARVLLLRLKDLHRHAYVSVLGRVEGARRVANVGIPKLSTALKAELAELHCLDRAPLEKAVVEHAPSIKKIEAFHFAIKTRFGLNHQIFGTPNTFLTSDQLVHLDVLKTIRPQITQAQALNRAIACLEFNESTELELERDWEPDWGR